MIEYREGAKCILKHCHDLHEEPERCKRKFVRSTLLSPNTNGITRVFSRVNGPVRDNFECSGELANCGCCHSEIKVVQDLLDTAHQSYFQYILLCSYSPCTRCANAIIYSDKISAVIYDIMTEHDTRGEERLSQCMPVLTKRQIEEIAVGHYRGELSFVKRWGGG